MYCWVLIWCGGWPLGGCFDASRVAGRRRWRASCASVGGLSAAQPLCRQWQLRMPHPPASTPTPQHTHPPADYMNKPTFLKNFWEGFREVGAAGWACTCWSSGGGSRDVCREMSPQEVCAQRMHAQERVLRDEHSEDACSVDELLEGSLGGVGMGVEGVLGGGRRCLLAAWQAAAGRPAPRAIVVCAPPAWCSSSKKLENGPDPTPHP